MGCGSDEAAEADRPEAELAWVEPPKLYRPPNLPRDRIAQGEIASEDEPIELHADELRVLDADGGEVDAAVAFVSGYVPSIEPLNQLSELPEDEERRLGRLATVVDDPVPLTISWRQPPGSGRPVELDYGPGALPIPRG